MSRLIGLPRNAGVAVLGLAVLAAACGGDDDDANARQDYVDAVVAVSGSDDLTEAQSICFAESVVDAIGVEKLDKATSPRGIRNEKTSNMVDLGVDVTTEEAEDFYERINRCVDLRQSGGGRRAGPPAASLRVTSQTVYETLRIACRDEPSRSRQASDAAPESHQPT